jgi:PEP-CTERM motif
MLRLQSWAAALALGAAVASAPALAAPLPITGGTTSVKLTSASTLAGAGLTVGILGTAEFSPGSDDIPLVYFPVTGGSIDTGSFAGSIEHDGSGLRLSTASASVSLTNFVIDTVSLSLTGDVAFGSTSLADVPLFNIGLSGSPFLPFTLTLTSTAAGALSTIFGIPNLTGATIGLANTVPISAVPEPATVASMLAGLGLMGLMLGRRRRAVQEPRPLPA